MVAGLSATLKPTLYARVQLKPEPLTSALEAESHYKLQSENTSQGNNCLKNRGAALRCCRSYSEAAILHTELLNNSPEPRKELGCLHFPLQGVIQVNDTCSSLWRAKQTDLTEPLTLSRLIKEEANKDRSC